jgi:hypothetical protein
MSNADITNNNFVMFDSVLPKNNKANGSNRGGIRATNRNNRTNPRKKNLNDAEFIEVVRVFVD